jgi:hypothetical protein
MNLHNPQKGEKGPTSSFNVNLQQTRLGHGWFERPDPDVDLCCLPIARIQELIPPPLAPFYIALEGISSDDVLKNLDVVEDVIMVGYPNGLWDHVNNLPLVRKGTTATHPGMDYKIEGQRVQA